jgi:hypothetical protein
LDRRRFAEHIIQFKYVISFIPGFGLLMWCEIMWWVVEKSQKNKILKSFFSLKICVLVFVVFDGCESCSWLFVIHQYLISKCSSWPHRSSQSMLFSDIIRGMFNIVWTTGVSILDGSRQYSEVPNNQPYHSWQRDTQIHCTWVIHLGMKKILKVWNESDC